MRRRILASMGGKSLPYLRRVAYLESTGTQWIDTGILPTAAMTFGISCARTPLSPLNVVFFGVRQGGSYIDSGMQCYLNSNLSAEIRFRNTYFLTFTANVYVLQEFQRNWDSGIVQSDYEMRNFSDMFVNPNLVLFTYRITLFAFNVIGSVNTSVGVCKIAAFSIRTNGDLLIDMIPVLDFSGRPCMYNQAQSSAPADDPSRFFYNQGTGDDFEWGEL